MAAGEVENVAYQFMMNLGRGVEWDPEEFDAVAAVIPGRRFNRKKIGLSFGLKHGLRFTF